MPHARTAIALRVDSKALLGVPSQAAAAAHPCRPRSKRPASSLTAYSIAIIVLSKLGQAASLATATRPSTLSVANAILSILHVFMRTAGSAHAGCRRVQLSRRHHSPASVKSRVGRAHQRDHWSIGDQFARQHDHPLDLTGMARRLSARTCKKPVRGTRQIHMTGARRAVISLRAGDPHGRIQPFGIPRRIRDDRTGQPRARVLTTYYSVAK